MMLYNKFITQRGYTLIELMLALAVSAIVISLGALYTRNVYRGNTVNEAEQLILQVITVAKHYHTQANKTAINNKIHKQYDGIDTTWVANTGNIPAKYIQRQDDTVTIFTPWGEPSSINVSSGSKSTQLGKFKDNYLFIEVDSLPNYGCVTLQNRLLVGLGGSVNQNGVQATYIECDEDEESGENTLYIMTNPLLY